MNPATTINLSKSLISLPNAFVFLSNFSHNPTFYQSLLKSSSLYLNSIFKTHIQKPTNFAKPNHQIDLEIDNSLLSKLSPNGLSEFDKKIQTNKVSLVPASVISSYILHNKPNEAFTSFLEFRNSNRDIDPGTCNSLLALLSSNGYLEFAKIVFDTMLKRGISLSSVGLGVFIGALCRVSELEECLEFLDRTKQRMEGIYGSVIAFSIIDGLCRASRVYDASRALEELRFRGFKPDFIAYRVVVEGLRSMGRVDEVERISKLKRKLGVAPRMNEYKEFIFCLISERRVREAKELGEALVDGSFPIDDEVFNALIGSVSGVDPNSAVSFCKSMIEKERFPSLFTLKTLSSNLYRNTKTDEMWDIFQLLLSEGYFSDLESYNVMVSFLCKAGRVKEAYSVFKEMRKKGVSPDVFSYNSLMEACCREDLLRPAKKLWDEMFVNGCRGNLQTYNTLIQKFSENGEAEEAQHLFHHMLEKGVEPDAVTYTSLIKGLCRDAKINAALEIFNKSMEQDIALAGSTLNALVFSLCKEGNFLVASKVMRGLPHSDLENTNSHIILLQSLANAGEMNMAIKHIEWVKDSFPFKLPSISAELVASLSSSLKPEPVLQLLQAMRERGLVSKNDPWINLCKESFSWH